MLPGLNLGSPGFRSLSVDWYSENNTTFRNLALFPSSVEKAVSFSSDREQPFKWVHRLRTETYLLPLLGILVMDKFQKPSTREEYSLHCGGKHAWTWTQSLRMPGVFFSVFFAHAAQFASIT